MLIILSWEEPGWRVYGVEPKVEAEGPSIEEAFVAFYDALNGEGGQHVEFVGDHSNPVPGVYRIQLKEGAAGRLRAHSADILGLSLEGSAEQVLLDLPDAIVSILGQQEHFSRIC